MSKISVIMSIYKESKDELEKSIYSILNQTFTDFEYIIVIDNPIDKWRVDYVKSISDKRIKLIINEKNLGLTKSLNIALSYAKGKYIARMDADDISMPNRLEKELDYLIKNNLDMCGSYVTCFIGEKDIKKIKFPVTYKGIKKVAYIQNCIAHPTFFVKKEIYDCLKGYNNVIACEDYDFLLRALDKGYKIGNVPEVLLKYRISPSSISRSNPGKQILISNYIKKFYKKNTNFYVTEEMINEFLLSKKYIKQIKSFDYYWNMKNIRLKYKNEKSLKYYVYTFFVIFNFKHSLVNIFEKIYRNFVLYFERFYLEDKK